MDDKIYKIEETDLFNIEFKFSENNKICVIVTRSSPIDFTEILDILKRYIIQLEDDINNNRLEERKV